MLREVNAFGSRCFCKEYKINFDIKNMSWYCDSRLLSTEESVLISSRVCYIDHIKTTLFY